MPEQGYFGLGSQQEQIIPSCSQVHVQSQVPNAPLAKRGCVHRPTGTCPGRACEGLPLTVSSINYDGLHSALNQQDLIVCPRIFQPQINHSPFPASSRMLQENAACVTRCSFLQRLEGRLLPGWEMAATSVTACHKPPAALELPRRGKAPFYLLHLKFDGRFDLVHLGHQVLVVREEGWELASFVQARPQDSRNLLDQGLRSQEGIVLLGCEERIPVRMDAVLLHQPETALLRPRWPQHTHLRVLTVLHS